jgi:large subunit ribosomal protein L13
MIKTYSAKPTEVTRNWYVVDAAGQTLGRLATQIATKLTGKDKPMYTSHIDCGDFVVVINSDKLVVTGNKLADKKYYRHTGYPGGIKEISLEAQMTKDSTKVIEHAVSGMLPKNKLRDERLKRLKVYATDQHPHAPQQPTELKLTGKEAK